MGNKSKTTRTTNKMTVTPGLETGDALGGVLGRVQTIGSDTSGFTPTYSDPTMAGIGGLIRASGEGSPAYASLNNIVTGSGEGFTSGRGLLQGMAQGDYLSGNPHLNSVLSNSANAIADKVNSQFSAAGRYGSGAHTATLAKEIGEMDVRARMEDYARERGFQNAAAGQLYSGGFTGAGMARALDEARLQPARLALQAGGLLDQINNQQRLAPMNAVEWQLANTMPPATAFAERNNVGTQTSQQPNNWLTSGLGIAKMGLGVLTTPMTGGLGLMGTAASPSLLGAMTGYYR